MSRSLLVLALAAVSASAAFAKDLCIQVDNSSFAGSQIVVKKAKLGAGNVAPAQGYFAQFSQSSLSFADFRPMAGGSVVSSTGDLALGMTLYSPTVGPGGSVGNGTGSSTINCLCHAGPDGKIGALDSCSLDFDVTGATGHVVPCTDVVAIP